MNILELSEQEIVRRNNLEAIKELGIDPYPAAEYPTNAFSTDIIDSFTDDAPQRGVGHCRPHEEPRRCKASFAELQVLERSHPVSSHATHLS
jgi:lysyl-tRNA synthetase class 2